MLAARADQENFVHGQQTAAASKPLNQGLRGLTAKTPGHKAPKTPFKVPLNDENAPFQAGKSVLKTNNGKVGTVGKKVTLDKSAFVTPAGPKNRQALGAKTTNAKAHVFLTPGPKNAEPSPSKTQQKTGSPRLRRPKVKVLQSEPVVENVDDDDYEIEYMPPRGEPLKDYPSDDEFGPDKTFPHLLPGNLTRGWNEVYMNPVDEHGVHLSDRERAERRAKADKIAESKFQKQFDELFSENEASVFQDLGLSPPKHVKPVASATMSRKAASALAVPEKVRRLANSAIAAKSRAPAGLNVRKTRQPEGPATKPSATRFASANAASRSTLGYAQGRAISQKVRKPVTSVFRDNGNANTGAKHVRNASAVPVRSPSEEKFDNLARDVVAQLRMQDLAVKDEDEDAELFGSVTAMDEDEDDFQLPLPT